MRSRPAIHLKRTPLVYVVLQVTITPVLALKKYIPDLQEQFRKKGFPRYEESVINFFGLSEDLSPTITQTPRFDFYDRERRTGILLHPNTITIETNKYDTFEHFQDSVGMAVEVFRDAVNVMLAERVGLRYVDWIRPEGQCDVSALLNPGLQGFAADRLGFSHMLRNFTTQCTTNVGTLLIRIYDQLGKIQPMPSQPIGLSYDQQPGAQEVVTLLDLDHFSQQSFDFDREAIGQLAWRLHDSLDLAFREAVTAEARKLWGEGE